MIRENHVTKSSLVIKIVLAVVGCFLGVYVGQELVGGGALGWTATGAIVASFCHPLFQTLLALRQSRQ
jgi:Zn-dependent protease with chaperone function